MCILSRQTKLVCLSDSKTTSCLHIDRLSGGFEAFNNTYTSSFALVAVGRTSRDGCDATTMFSVAMLECSTSIGRVVAFMSSVGHYLSSRLISPCSEK